MKDKCNYCGSYDIKIAQSQYKDIDNDYDDCTITYCADCRMTLYIDL